MSSGGIGAAISRILRDALKAWLKPSQGSGPEASQTRTPKTPPKVSSHYPGDYLGTPPMSYDPHPGRLADPGEVAWTWVPFEEDHARGKDRPVLVVGRDGDWLLALMMTSKDHDRDAAQEARAGRHWIDVGTGSWDPQRRESEVRVDRVIRINPDEVRRVSDKFPKDKFDLVAAAVRRHT